MEKQVLVDILFVSCLTLDLHTLQKSLWLILENLYQLFYDHFVYWSNYKPNWMLSPNTGWNVFIPCSCLMSPGVGEHTAGMGINEARCGRWSQPEGRVSNAMGRTPPRIPRYSQPPIDTHSTTVTPAISCRTKLFYMNTIKKSPSNCI